MQINVDIGNIDRAVKELEQYQEQVDIAIINGLNEFYDRFELKLRANMVAYGCNTDILASVYCKRIGFGLMFTIAGEQLAYFEYGTGIIGSQNPHPKPFTNWQYDVNNHGEKGWVYPVKENSWENDKQFVGKNGVMLAWTQGQPSRPFLYETWLWGTRSITNIIRKHLRRASK